jgi:hypothetical protein
MPAPAIVGTDTTTAVQRDRIQRKEFRMYVDTSDRTGDFTPAGASWYVIGEWTEDASVTLNPDIATFANILGDTKVTLNRFEQSAAIPQTLYVGDALGAKIVDDFRYGRLSKFTNYAVMIVWTFLDHTNGYHADIYTESSLIPDSIGGSSYVDVPITVNLAGKVLHGTVDDWASDSMAFTEDTTSPLP